MRCGVARALLQYWNTPSRRDGLSPAQKLFGRPVQDILQAHRRVFATEWQHSVDDAEEQAHEYVEQHYNRHAWPLTDFCVGSNVALQNPVTKRWDIYGVISDIGQRRQYYIKTAGGTVFIHNAAFRHRLPALPTYEYSQPFVLHHLDVLLIVPSQTPDRGDYPLIVWESRLGGGSVGSLDPRPSDLCILMEGLVHDDHLSRIEVEPT